MNDDMKTLFDKTEELKDPKDKASCIGKAINNGEMSGKIKITAEDSIKYKKTAQNEVSSSDIRQNSSNISTKEKRRLVKETKIIKEGYSCIVIRPSGIMKKQVVPKSKEILWFEERIGGKVSIESASELEYGDLTGSQLCLIYSNTSNCKKNKRASKLLGRNINGVCILYSTLVELNVDMFT